MDSHPRIRDGLLLAAACFFVLYAQGAFAQIYSVHSPSSGISSSERKETSVYPRWEIYAGPVLSLQPLKDDRGDQVSSAFYGLAGGLRLRVLPRLAMGLEGQYLPQTASHIPFTDSISQRALYVSARWDLTPDTSPGLWLEGGAGRLRTEWKLELAFAEQRLTSSVFFIGAGTGGSLGRGWRGGLSVRLLYMSQTDFDFLFHYASSTGLQGLLFIAKMF